MNQYDEELDILTSSACSPNTMDMRVDVASNVEVDHIPDLRYIQTSR